MGKRRNKDIEMFRYFVSLNYAKGYNTLTPVSFIYKHGTFPIEWVTEQQVDIGQYGFRSLKSAEKFKHTKQNQLDAASGGKGRIFQLRIHKIDINHPNIQL